MSFAITYDYYVIIVFSLLEVLSFVNTITYVPSGENRRDIYMMQKESLLVSQEMVRKLHTRTLPMDLWASLEHDIKYKSLSNNIDSLDAMELDIDEELLQAAELIYAQQKFEIMNSIMEK